MTTTLPPLEALEAFIPASPAGVSPTASIADLEQIRLGWIGQGKAEQIPDRMFEIAFWLGNHAPDNRGDYRSLEIGDLVIWASIKQGTRNIGAEAWNTERRVTVYKSGKLLVRWLWNYLSQKIDDEPDGAFDGASDDLLFIPGKWLATVLAQTPKAEQVQRDHFAGVETMRRDALAKKLLVGMEI